MQCTCAHCFILHNKNDKEVLRGSRTLQAIFKTQAADTGHKHDSRVRLPFKNHLGLSKTQLDGILP